MSLALVLACGGAAAPAQVEVTRVVTEQVETPVEVTRVVTEQVETSVEVTRVVTEQVEKEVIKEVLVVATPVPPVEAVVRQGDPTGTLTVSLQNLGAQVTDPILQGRAGHAQYQAPIYDALLGFNHESQYGGVGPGVAQEWGIDPDGTSWTFNIAPGLVFHNGEVLDAHDVKFSLERTMYHGESVVGDGNRLNRQLRQPSEEAIEVIDDLTLRMHTEGSKPHFWSLLTRAVFQGGQIMPKDYIESVGDEGFRAEPVGSGPWMYAEHSVGDYFRYEAFDKSHRGIPHFANMSLLLVPEESTKLAMVRTGQADLIDLVPESAPEVEAAGAQLTVIEGVGMFIYQFWGLYWPEAQALPIGDVRVRQAMSLAINRQDIIDFTLNGYGRPSMPFATFPTSVDVDVPRWQQWGEEALVYDPERAKELLAEAGYPDGFEVTFWSTNFSGTPYVNDLSQAVTGFWDEIGIESDLKIIEIGTFSPLTRRPSHDEWGEGFNGAVSIFRNAGRPLPVPRYQSTFHPDSNHVAFGDRDNMTPEAVEYLRLHEIAISERDDAKRAEATNAIIQLVADQWIGVPIVQGVSLYASNPETVGRWQGIYGRGELGDVFHRIPHAEGNPWQ